MYVTDWGYWEWNHALQLLSDNEESVFLCSVFCLSWEENLQKAMCWFSCLHLLKRFRCLCSRYGSNILFLVLCCKRPKTSVHMGSWVRVCCVTVFSSSHRGFWFRPQAQLRRQCRYRTPSSPCWTNTPQNVGTFCSCSCVRLFCAQVQQVQHIYPSQVQYIEGGETVYTNGTMWVKIRNAVINRTIDLEVRGLNNYYNLLKNVARKCYSIVIIQQSLNIIVYIHKRLWGVMH